MKYTSEDSDVGVESPGAAGAPEVGRLEATSHGTDGIGAEMAPVTMKDGGIQMRPELPIDFPRRGRRGAGERVAIALSADTNDRLLTLADKWGVSSLAVFSSAAGILFSRLYGLPTFIVGYRLKGVQTVQVSAARACDTIVPLRMNVADKSSFSDLAKMTGASFQAADEDSATREHGDGGVEQAPTDRHPLFDVVLGNGEAVSDPLREGAAGPADGPEVQAKHDMELRLVRGVGKFRIEMVYDGALWTKVHACTLGEQTARLLEEACRQPDRPVAEYSSITPGMAKWLPDPTRMLEPQPHEDFCAAIIAWAQRTPDAPAVASEAHCLTYRQLVDRADDIARRLPAAAKHSVVIFGQRNASFVVAMVGVLMSGNVILTVDPSLPEQRVRAMIEQAGADILIDVSGDAVPPAFLAGRTWTLYLRVSDHETKLLASTRKCGRPVEALQRADAAYIFFTSGSTGHPKGILGSRKGVSQFLHWQRTTFGVGPGDRCSQLIASSFDVIMRDIFLPLSSGATLCLPHQREGAMDMLEWAGKTGITRMHAVPTLMELWLTTSHADVRFEQFRTLFLAGEPLSTGLVQRLRGLPGFFARIVNLYGPTETTLAKAALAIEPENWPHRISVGRPLPGSQILILRSQQQPCAAGEIGEAAIRTGYGSLGYLDGTSGGFRPNPFRAGETIFFTGDYARYTEDGCVEILGRRDFQIKIRGVRVELGEVTSVLKEHPEVVSAVSVAREIEGEKRVVSFVTARSSRQDLERELLRHCRGSLLGAMVPTRVVPLDHMPLLPNGKIDRSALPAAEARAQVTEAYAAPRDAWELQLAEVLQAVLKRPRVGIDDNFFDLNGDSIRAIRIVSRLAKSGINLKPGDFFQHPTIRSLAKHRTEIVCDRKLAGQRTAPESPRGEPPRGPEIAPEGNRATPALDPRLEARARRDLAAAGRRVKSIRELTPTQHRMLLQCRDSADRGIYIVQKVIEIEGRIDPDICHRALGMVIDHHAGLRTQFFCDESGGAGQAFLHDGLVAFQHATQAMLNSEEAAEATQRHLRLDRQKAFNLAQDPLVRMHLFERSGNAAVMIVTYHHIAMDGWSFEIFLADFLQCYRHLLQGGDLPSPPSYQYSDFLDVLSARRTDEAIAHWRKYLEGSGPQVRLPFVVPERRDQAELMWHDASGTRGLAASIAEVAQRLTVTPNSVLQAVWSLFLAQMNGADDIVFGNVTCGRSLLPEAAEEMVGLLIAVVPLRVRIDEARSFREFVTAIQHDVRDGDLYSNLPIGSAPELGVGGSPVLDHLVVFQNYLADQEAPGREQLGFRIGDVELLDQNGYDFSLFALQRGGKLSIRFRYNRSQFPAAACDTVARILGEIAHAVASAPDSPLGTTAFGCCRDDSARGDGSIGSLPTVGAAEFRSVVSAHQERILFVDRFEAKTLYKGSPIYHNAVKILDIEGTVSIDRLQDGITALARCHEILRARLPYADGAFSVVVGENPPSDLLLREARCENREAAIDHLIASAVAPYQIEEGPLFRFELARYGTGRFLLCIGAHHAVADKGTLDLLARELVDLYHGESPDGFRPEMGPSFADFARRQREEFERGMAAAKFYWTAKLRSDHLPVLDLPTDHTRDVVHVYATGRHSFAIGPSLANRVLRLAGEIGCSPRDILLTVFISLAYRYAKQRTGIIGISAPRREGRSARIAGPVAALLPILTELPEQFTFRQAVARVTRAVGEAVAFGDVPFERIVDLANPAKDMSRTALFDLLFQFENAPVWPIRTEGWSLREIETNMGWGKYDLNLLLRWDVTGTSGHLTYNRRYFEESSIHRFVEAYVATLASVLDRPDAALSSTVVTGDAERSLTAGWEGPEPLALPAAGPRSLAQCFEATCDRFPDRPAITAFTADGEPRTISYADLDRRANALARVLRQEDGAGRGALVGLLLNDAVEAMVGILAVLKTGAAYVPLDPKNPPVRLRRICEDCSLACVLTTTSLRERVAAGLAPTRCLDELGLDSCSDRIEATAGQEDVAYVIYTSGSTGIPKGVLIEHRSVFALFEACKKDYHLDHEDVWTSFHSYAFDVSVWEIWGAFLHGGKVVCVPEPLRRDPGGFKQFLSREGVTVLSQTPAPLYHLIEASTEEELRSLKQSLRYVISCGERLDLPPLARWFAAPPGRALIINMYGITETTVHSTFHVVDAGERAADINRSIIGRPLRGVSLRVLDQNGRRDPIGVTGEIHVGGKQLARGYLNRPELTHERFTTSSLDGKRCYRSGDLGRWTAEGVLEYIGRNDSQIQLRGFRIEIGEIESALKNCTGVRESVVKVRSVESSHEIVAYCVFDDPRPVLSAIRSELLRSLPEYMLPARFVILDRMPLTINGKIDRRELPVPDSDNMLTDGSPAASEDPVEASVLTAFRKVLKNKGVGMTADFFASGGHSLAAMSLVGEIEGATGVRLDLAAVFELRTPRGLAGRVRALESRKPTGIPLAAEQKYYPLSSFQKQVYVEHVLKPASCQFNLPFALRIEGRLDVGALRAALEYLLARREVLRTRFVMKQNEPFQQILGGAVLDFEYRRNHQFAVPEGLAELIKPFDLQRPPLFRAVLIETGADQHVLFVDVHHIAFDMFSFPLLVDDLIAGYRGLTVPIVRRLEYRDFAAWESAQMNSVESEELYEYWVGKLTGAPPSPELPGIRPGTRREAAEAGIVGFQIDGDSFRLARAYIQGRGTTPYTFFLAAFQVALALRTNVYDVVVGSDDANRDSAERRGIMGFFVNQLVLRSRINVHLSFEEQLARVADEVAASLRHKALSFYRIVERLNPARRSGRNPMFQVKFDYVPNLRVDPEVSWKASPIQLPGAAAKNDLHMFVQESDDAFICSLHFDPDVYGSGTAADFSTAYRDLLVRIIKNPELTMNEMSKLGKKSDATARGLRGFRRHSANVQPGAIFEERLPEARSLPLIMTATVGDVDLENWLPARKEQILDKLRKHGAILFRGCQVNSIDRFERVVGAICPDMIKEYGDLPSVSEGAKVYASTPYPPDKKILFHNESSHLPSWPKHQFFACLKPADRGGETPLVDCREIYRRLRPELRSLFEQKGLTYVRTFVRGFDVSWQDFFKTEDQGEVRAFCARNQMECEWIDGVGLQTRSRSPAVLKHPVTGEMSFFNQIQLHHPAFLEADVLAGMRSVLSPRHFPRSVMFGDGTPIEDAIALETYRVYRECEIALPWEKGDLIMLDNLSVAHARNEYEGSRSIIVGLADLMHAPAGVAAIG